MWLDAKQCPCFHLEVDFFPETPHIEMFIPLIPQQFLPPIAILNLLKNKRLYFNHLVLCNVHETS